MVGRRSTHRNNQPLKEFLLQLECWPLICRPDSLFHPNFHDGDEQLELPDTESLSTRVFLPPRKHAASSVQTLLLSAFQACLGCALVWPICPCHARGRMQRLLLSGRAPATPVLSPAPQLETELA